jgi:multicomponent Na+:H+ antiporter subunit F
MFIAAVLALLVAIGLSVARAWLGPTVFDRVLATNTIGTLAVCLMASYGFMVGRPEFLDLAIVYALLNVLSTLAILKYFRFGSLGDPEDESAEKRPPSAAKR